MQLLAQIVLVTHIAAGFTAFFVGPGAMLTRKGGRWHRRWGKIFFWAMALVALSAVLLTYLRPNPFLTLVAVFSFYAAFSGYRVLRQKRPDKGQTPQLPDWLAALLTAVAGSGLVYMGLFRFGTLELEFSPVMLVFGLLCLALAGQDIYRFVKPFNPATDSMNWYLIHMGNMLGAYVAALTAFSAVNFDFLPPVVRWLWPTALGVPGITLWTRYYARKFSRRKKTSRLTVADPLLQEERP